ncbi:MAG: hypothetical protein IPJ34_06240 [Myxococcales bacterium]|nr:hypothetical protein [Myxococcales bacterium]
MDDARRKILERRSRFVAAAISTIAIGCEPPAPQPCLKTAPPDAMSAPDEGVAEDASAPEEDATTVPQPCLSPQVCLSPVPPPDTGPPDTGTPDVKPHPCLKIAPPKKDAGPKVCLDFAQ